MLIVGVSNESEQIVSQVSDCIVNILISIYLQYKNFGYDHIFEKAMLNEPDVYCYNCCGYTLEHKTKPISIFLKHATHWSIKRNPTAL